MTEKDLHVLCDGYNALKTLLSGSHGRLGNKPVTITTLHNGKLNIVCCEGSQPNIRGIVRIEDFANAIKALCNIESSINRFCALIEDGRISVTVKVE